MNKFTLLSLSSFFFFLRTVFALQELGFEVRYLLSLWEMSVLCHAFVRKATETPTSLSAYSIFPMWEKLLSMIYGQQLRKRFKFWQTNAWTRMLRVAGALEVEALLSSVTMALSPQVLRSRTPLPLPRSRCHISARRRAPWPPACWTDTSRRLFRNWPSSPSCCSCWTRWGTDTCEWEIYFVSENRRSGGRRLSFPLEGPLQSEVISANCR